MNYLKKKEKKRRYKTRILSYRNLCFLIVMFNTADMHAIVDGCLVVGINRNKDPHSLNI